MPTVTVSVRSTRYYRAAEAQRRGILAPGAAVVLRHEPLNRHDHNAVEVILLAGDVMLGHVRRGLAPRCVALLRAGAVTSAEVAKVAARKDRLGIRLIVHIAVTYVGQIEPFQPISHRNPTIQNSTLAPPPVLPEIPPPERPQRDPPSQASSPSVTTVVFGVIAGIAVGIAFLLFIIVLLLGLTWPLGQ